MTTTTPTFTDSTFINAGDKMKVFKGLTRFIEGGMKRTQFTKPVYSRLTLDFGHIAHYNIDGFYQVWCSTPQSRFDWIKHLLKEGGYNEAKELVEAVRTWLKETNQLERYQAEANQSYQNVLADVKANPEKYAQAFFR